MEYLPILRKLEEHKEIWLAQPILGKETSRKYASWLNDPKVVSGIGSLEKVSEREAYGLLKSWSKDPLKLCWFIYFREKGSFVPIGDINLDIITPENKGEYSEFSLDQEFDLIPKKAEIKIMISGEYQQKGLGKLATKTVIEDGLNRMKLDALYASIYKENTGSLALFEKLCFKTVGCLKEKITGREEVIMRLSPLKSNPVTDQ